MNGRHIAAAMLVCALMGGCATLTEGLNQTVAIMTPGADGALCVLSNDANETLGSVTTPGSIEVSKSRNDLTIHCSKPGFEPAQRRVSSHWANRAKLQGPPGHVIDYVSGAMWNYPPKIEIVLVATVSPSPRITGRSRGQSDR